MLLEMQNAMNNMMSNSGQLHSMLSGTQSPARTMDALPNDSSPSSSSSCSNPSSPQCPQDSESMVSMDTNSSSASSCSSDSGEDESIFMAARQHKGAFSYDGGKQSSTSQCQGTPFLVARETQSNHSIEKQQGTWNGWNHSVVGGYQHGYQHSHYSNSQPITSGPYREERVIYEKAQHHLNSATIGGIIDDNHQRKHNINKQTVSNGISGSAYNVDQRAHLVSAVCRSSFCMSMFWIYMLVKYDKYL